MRKRHVDALSVKSGPTESGGAAPPIIPEQPVGGELLPNTLPVFLSQYWLLIILLLIPLALLFYKKRSNIFPRLLRLITN